jgi:hypothetical protein
VGGFDGFADAVGDGITCGYAEEEGGTDVVIIPYGEGSLEMGQADDGCGVHSGVGGVETQDLSLGATGGGAAQTGTKLAQIGIAVLPGIARRGVAAKENFGSRGGPVRRRIFDETAGRSRAIRTACKSRSRTLLGSDTGERIYPIRCFTVFTEQGELIVQLAGSTSPWPFRSLNT